ncbi:MAG: dihydroneopterin aldolase [Bacteroidales bacterium]|nr:dihydroneopterin aldolase [Bacteroidales bacterium]MDD4528464.1 dihydroneopterin aldolase [Bacteroidales bacterium]MDD4830145.1 dihydroneopterin aldolase [Bacteroidales bacterium]
MAVIELENMSFYGFHGCFDEEQKIGTHFRVDLEFEADTFKAEQSDNINDTVNYLSVYQTIKRVFEEPSHLLERTARKIGDTLLKEYPQMEYCKIKITKKNPPLGGKLDGVSVSLVLRRTGSK